MSITYVCILKRGINIKGQSPPGIQNITEYIVTLSTFPVKSFKIPFTTFPIVLLADRHINALAKAISTFYTPETQTSNCVSGVILRTPIESKVNRICYEREKKNLKLIRVSLKL